MKKAFKITKQDMKNIIRVPSILILIIGLAILPSFYAWFNIKASWDPYANTQGIKIGVVSDDLGTEVEDRSINMGDELVENLKENDSLGWQFGDSIEEADEKVYTGEYFATIHIPETFSEDVASILNEEPRSAIVQYKVNEKINAIAPKMTDTGATQITETINDEFVQTTAKTLLEEFNNAGIELEENLPTLQKIRDAVYNLHDHIDDIDEAGDLIVQLDEDQDKIQNYADTLDSLQEYESNIREGGDQILTAQSHLDDINRLGDAVIELNQSMPDIENALTRISSIQQYFPAINQGLEDAYAASITAGDTLADVQERIPEINNQIQDYQNQVDNAQDTLDEAEQVTDEVTELVHSRINDAGEIINGLPSFDFNTEESVTPDFVNNVKDSVGDSQGNLEEMLEELRNSDSLESNESLEKLSSSADGTVEQGNDLSAELEDMLTQIEADNFTEEDINTLNEAIADYQSSFDEVKEDLANAEFIPDTSQGEENSDNVEEDTEQDSEENNDNAEEDTEQGNEDAEQSEDPKETPQRDEEIDQVINELHDDTMQAFDEISNVLDQNIDLAKSNIQQLPELIAMKENPDRAEYAEEQIQAIQDSIEGLQSSITSTQNSLALLEVPENKEELEKIQDTLENGDSNLNDIIDFLANGDFDLSQLEDVKDNAINDLDTLQTFNEDTLEPFVNNAFTTLENRLNDADSKLDAALEYTDLASDYLSEAATVVNDSQYYLNLLNENLPYYEEQFSDVSDTVNQHFPEFKNGVNMASSFFQNDMPHLEDEVNNLAGFVTNDMDDLIEQYENLNSLVQDNLPEAQEAIGEMADFIRDDWPGYKEDIQNAYDRIKQMEDDQIIEELIAALQNDLSDETEYFSRPVQLDEEKLFAIPNYGSANTPFYTVLALWVGALLLCNLITTELKDKNREAFSLRDIYLGRMTLFLIVAILQAVIVSLGNIFILDAYMAHPAYFTLFSVLIALAFMIIVYTLVSLFGNVGKAVAIIFMILQLSGGGGMFPIQVAPEFFQAIHPFLPFTYAIDILREASGGIVWSVVFNRFLILAIFPAIFILLGYTFRPWIAPRVHKAYMKTKKSNMVD
ncbi:YhgE/Pip domain-containing protein [Oceanobacillus jeddahense]|uniref:YhgE/Pip domain-containing protein n=1 Tax=Oceanobacillus jeddahense TaxID=1462527 RepID=A0ABY5K034_9BACI|nr:YhgE/Pip domain-containing protein [Oceanobacillus jeddahense]UUI04134.1 YhgE/Pip domain-containing protein [Oceanobacillus jeddahense]